MTVYEKYVNILVQTWRKEKKITVCNNIDDSIFDSIKSDSEQQEKIAFINELYEKNLITYIHITSRNLTYSQVKLACNSINLPCDNVYNTLPINHHVYLDDRAGLELSYNMLKDAYQIIKKENEYCSCTTDPYIYIKELMDYKEKNNEVYLPDLSLLLQFKLFMLAPIAIYKGIPLEAVLRKVPFNELEDALNKFSVLYRIIKHDEGWNTKEYIIRGILKEKLEIKE